MVWIKPQGQTEAALRRNPGIARGVEKVADAVSDELRGIAIRDANDQGTYIEGIRAERVGRSNSYRVGSNARHASALEGGTGVFGPKRRPIVARTVFVFQTDVEYDGPGGPVATGRHSGDYRTLKLYQHQGMEGRHLVARAAILVAFRSNRLRYRARRWLRRG